MYKHVKTYYRYIRKNGCTCEIHFFSASL